jgi:type IV pilus assembly protein PilM
MSFMKTDTNQVGLDIGTTGIRVVELKNPHTSPKLVAYGSVDIDTKVVQSDAQIDRQAVSDAVSKLLTEAKISSKNVIAGLPSAKVFASLVNMPKMSEQEMSKSIRYQAEQYVPMNLDQVKLDHAVVGETPDGKQQEVLLVGSPISLAERYLHLLESVGLDVQALEPDASALARSLVNNKDAAVVILDMGALSTDLVTVHNGQPKLIRSIPVGGETFVKTASQSLNIEPQQAFQFVYKFGLTTSKLEGQVRGAIKNNVDSLVSELDKSNKFFLSRYKNLKLSKVIITGKASILPEFPAYLANAINLPVEIGNAWGRINVSGDQQQSVLGVANRFAVAAGLALRGIE